MTFAIFTRSATKSVRFSMLNEFTIVAFQWFVVLTKRNSFAHFFSKSFLSFLTFKDIFDFEDLILPILALNVNLKTSRTMGFTFLASFAAKSFFYTSLYTITIIAFQWFLVLIKRNMFVHFSSNLCVITMTILFNFFFEDLILPILGFNVNLKTSRTMTLALLASSAAKTFDYSSLYTVTVSAL